MIAECGALALFLLQSIWVVDDSGGPGVNFTDIPPAIAAAAEGDILLVKAGTYSHFTLTGKGLRILGEGSSTTLVSNPGANPWRTTVSNVPAGSVAYVDRMTFQGDPTQGPRLTVLGSSTRAVLADVKVLGSAPHPFTSPLGAGVVVDGAEAHVVRCQILGTAGCNNYTGGCGYGPHAPGPGLRILPGSSVFAGSCEIRGGNGGLAQSLISPSQPGAAGLLVSSMSGLPATLWAGDSSIFGGKGSDCFPFRELSHFFGGVG
jgi:hypothetical protein